MDTAVSTTGPSAHIECPACFQRISLRLWPAGDGLVEYDDGTATQAITLHLRVGCEAT